MATELMSTTQMQAASFEISYINSFVAWLDRGDRTAHSYIVNLRQFIAWLKYEQIDNPCRQDLINYRTWLTTEHDAISLDLDSAAGYRYRTDKAGHRIRVICKPNTIAQYLRIVRQFFTWADANNLYPNIAANIHAPKINSQIHRKEALTPMQVLKIEQSIAQTAAISLQQAKSSNKDEAGRVQRATEQSKRLYAIYLLAVNAGLRTVEISRANIKDFKTIDGQSWLYIWGKGHSEPDQRKPLAHNVALAIKDYLKSRTDHKTSLSPLFVSTGNRSHGKRIAPTTISTMLKRAMIDAGFDSDTITAHSLRHTAGTNVLQLTGDNIYLTQQYMRHKSPTTTEIYIHNNTEQQEANIAEQLYNRYHGSTQNDSATISDLMSRLDSSQIADLLQIAEQMANNREADT